MSKVRELRASLKDVAREIKELGQGRVGHLRIGVGETTGDQLLPEAISALLNDAPRVTLKVITSDNDLMLPALRDGQLDLVVNYLPAALPEGLVQERLYNEDMVVCTAANHRLAGLKRVTLEDLTQERWASTESVLAGPEWLRRAFEDRGLPAPRVAVESRAARVSLQSLSTSDLLGFTARSVYERGAQLFRLTELPIRELAWKRPVGVIHRNDAYLPPAARRLIETMRRLAQTVPAN